MNIETAVINNKSTIKHFKNEFDVDERKRILIASAETIILQCQSQSADDILNIIYENVDNMLHCTAIPKERKVPPHNYKMKECYV